MWWSTWWWCDAAAGAASAIGFGSRLGRRVIGSSAVGPGAARCAACGITVAASWTIARRCARRRRSGASGRGFGQSSRAGACGSTTLGFAALEFSHFAHIVLNCWTSPVGLSSSFRTIGAWPIGARAITTWTRGGVARRVGPVYARCIRARSISVGTVRAIGTISLWPISVRPISVR